MRFRYGEAGLHHVSAQAIAQLWRQIARRGDFETCLNRRFFRGGFWLAGVLFHDAAAPLLLWSKVIWAFAL